MTLHRISSPRPSSVQFGAVIVRATLSKNLEGGEDRFITYRVSGTKKDAHAERMSEDLLKFMYARAKAGRPYLKESHSATIRLGTAVDAELSKNADGVPELYIKFLLDPANPMGDTVLRQVTDEKNPIVYDCSVGLKNIAEEQIYDDDLGETINVLYPTAESEFDHVAMTPPEGQAYPDAHMVEVNAVGPKGNSVRLFSAKSLAALFDCAIIARGDTATESQEIVMAKLTDIQKARSDKARIAAGKIKAADAELDAARSKLKDLEAAKASTVECDAMRAKIAELEAAQAPPPAAGAKPPAGAPEIPAPIAKEAIAEMAKDAVEAELAARKSKLAELEAAKAEGADFEKFKECMKDIEMRKAELDAEAAKDADAEKDGDALMGYGAPDTALANVGEMQQMVKAFKDDATTTPEQWGQLAEHLESELTLLMSGLRALGNSGDAQMRKVEELSKALAAKPAARTTVVNGGVTVEAIREAVKKELGGEVAALRTQVEKIANTVPPPPRPARYNDPESFAIGEGVTGGGIAPAIREELNKIRDPGERQRVSAGIVAKLLAAARSSQVEEADDA